MKKGLCMLLASAMIFGSMAGGVVEAKVIVEVPQIPVTETFSDIYNDWYTEYVQYVYDTGLMSGMQGTKNFAPNANISKAQVAQAQLSYDSKKTLREKNVVSDFDLMTANNTLLSTKAAQAQAQAQLVNAQNSLSYTEVKSPADGVVGVLPYRVGALVGPSMPTPLTTVSDNSQMYVYFSMNENQVLALTRQYGSAEKAVKNMPELSLRLSDDSLYNRKGRVESISGVIDQSTGTAQLRAVFPNPDGLLLSGTSGSVIVSRTAEGVIVIPQSATFEVQDKVFVYQIVDGKASSKPVTVTRLADGVNYIVNSGLAEGDVIVAEGVGLLREGTPIIAKD